MLNDKLNTPQTFHSSPPVFMVTGELTGRKGFAVSCSKFFGQQHKTLSLFMGYRPGCLNDEVMWARVQRMGFGAKTDKSTTQFFLFIFLESDN